MQHQHHQQQHQQQQQSQAPFNVEPDALRNLMVNYIPTTVDEMQLRQLFERYGPIETVKIVCDRETRQSRGYGFVKFQTAASAQQAIAELNGFSILNKRLKVALAASGQQRNSNFNNNMNYGMFGGYPATPNPYQQQMMMYPQYMMQHLGGHQQGQMPQQSHSHQHAHMQQGQQQQQPPQQQPQGN